MWVPILLTVLSCYLLGNLNGAVSVTTIFSQEDIRKKGSGNAGLTNFIRNFGFHKAILVVLIDAGKAVLACFLGKCLLEPYGYPQEGMMLGAVAVSLGHDFPVTLGFRGGKGILSGFAVAMTMDFRCGLVILGVFLVAVALTRYVSLGSVLGALSLSVFYAVVYRHQPYLMAGGMLLGILAIIMHRSNLVRLIQGTESKIHFGKKNTGSGSVE